MTNRDRPAPGDVDEESVVARHLRQLEQFEGACVRALFVTDATGTPAEPPRFSPFLPVAEVVALFGVFMQATEAQRAILSERLANDRTTEQADAGPVFDLTDDELAEAGSILAKAISDKRKRREDGHEGPSHRRQPEERAGQHRPPNHTRKERLVEKRPGARAHGA